MKAFLMAATAAAAFFGVATPADAAKLLYRSYNNQGVLHGAMVLDTSKVYVDGGDRVIISTFAVSAPIVDRQVNSEVLISSGVKSGATFYEPLTGFYGSNVFGYDDTIASFNLPPADAKLFGNVAGPATTPVFNTGTYGIYQVIRGATSRDSTYAKTGSVVVTDVTKTGVSILAVTDVHNTRLNWLAVALGDKPETAALDNNSFKLTNFEGAKFDGYNGTKLNSIEFGLNTIEADGLIFPTIIPFFDGPNTDPSIFQTADATTSYDDPKWRGLTNDGTSVRRFYRAFTPAEALAGAVPEPGTWAMLIIGIGLTGAAMRRRTRTTIAYQ